ncbi:hypothetical protein EYF80_049099 [Liparis tanakae]|uniref:Uncharacterized protein n=1 Tax=Liparis tanakae TaxID=230148 RepID=A0A4Z2FKE4_9TELE|nr:hypothetical protein EYF80_049099 [Liparis tanakae]
MALTSKHCGPAEPRLHPTPPRVRGRRRGLADGVHQAKRAASKKSLLQQRLPCSRFKVYGPLPANDSSACGSRGALPGYKPLVCTDKKT